MHIEFDPVKNEQNIRLRGLSFERAAAFDFDTGIIAQDVRKNYPEARYVALGFLAARLHVLCFTPERSTAMSKRTPLTDADGEVRELSAADLRRFKPAQEALPAGLQKTLGMKPRGPQKAPTKQMTTIRLSPEVMSAFRATGPGWQTRVDAALKDWLSTHALG